LIESETAVLRHNRNRLLLSLGERQLFILQIFTEQKRHITAVLQQNILRASFVLPNNRKDIVVMKIKAALLSLILLNLTLLSGCVSDKNNVNPGVPDGGSESTDSGIPDEDALNGLKTAAAEAERIVVTIGSETGSKIGFGKSAEVGQTGFKTVSKMPLSTSKTVLSADNTLIGWGLGHDRDDLGRPVDAVKAQEKYGGNSALFIDTSEEKRVFLTFDEGYENGYTGKILDTLKEKGVKATFFVTYDYCVSSPDLVKRMIEEGHTVGNHSYTHPSFPSCSEEVVVKEVKTLHDYVKENFNYEMKLFRFPMGEFSERTLLQLKEMGYTSVFWSFAYKDWSTDSQPATEEALETVTSAVHSGAIYLLHAVSKANAEALGDIIDCWANEGYRVADIEELLR